MNYKEFFSKGKELGFDDIQIVIKECISTDLKISNNDLIYYQNDSGCSYNIKAIINNKCVELNSDYLDIDVLDLLKEKSSVVEDSTLEEFLSDTSINNSVYSSLKYDDINDTIDTIYSLNNKRDNLVNKVITLLSLGKNTKRIINSNGVDIITPSTYCHVSMILVNEKEQETTEASTGILETSLDKIDFYKLYNELNDELYYKLRKNDITTGKYNVIIKNDVISILLNKMISVCDMDSILENISFLKDSINTKVFSDKLSIIEDPKNLEYPGYTLFDDEGTLTNYKELITNGVLNMYLTNNKMASKYNVKSTGNKYGSSIGVRNLYIKEGDKSFDELVKELGNGLIIDDCMGYHASIKLNNGTISLQAFGMLVSDGKIVSSFTPVVMTTNYKELFNNIVSIGNDLKFKSMGCGAPSILFKDISIASK